MKIASIRFGSQMYGTSTPESDTDLKSVFIPSGQDILMGWGKQIISTSTGDPKAKNTAEDIDEESFALQRFLKMCAEGQTVCIDMLFAPKDSMILGSETWDNIQANTHRLLTKKSKTFIGYCRAQANKYGIRGSRVAAARAALEFLQSCTHTLKLNHFAYQIAEMCKTQNHMQIIDIPAVDGSSLLHWEVCNKKLPFTVSIKTACEIVAKIVAEYGHRALEAEKNQGVDWKALSHAVRIAEQGIELLDTGKITFPRPNRHHLMDIKAGRLTYQFVADEIDQLLLDVEAAALVSSLPEEADHDWINDLVYTHHYLAVVNLTP